MGTADNLKIIIARQKIVLSELEAECRELESSDLAKENLGLNTELAKLRADLEKIGNEAALLSDDNARYKNALYEQIYNEKVNIVNTTAQKMDVYFRSGIEGELDRLSALEHNVTFRIRQLRESIARYNIDTQGRITSLLDEASFLLNQKVTEARAYAARTPSAFSPEELEALEAMRNEQITDEQIREVVKKNNFERFLGLNVLNATGILLLIVGAIALALFAYLRLPDVMKGLLIFVLGGVMLAAGEMMNRKKPTVFSLGISAGGIGILYTAMIMSYLNLHILDRLPTVAICVLITAGAFVLSSRYNSQIISCFALVGGYLPVFAISESTSFGSDALMVYGAMAYFVALNIFALLISFRKKWRATMFIGLFLNIFATGTIASDYPAPADALMRAPLILYILFAFLVYTFIPIISTYRTKAKFRGSDVALLAINTVFSSAIMFFVFESFGMEDYFGLLAIIIAAVYLFFGKYIDMKFAGEERAVRVLFYITGLTFVVLFVPLQLETTWLSLGWLVEGVLLATYGILKNDRRFRIAGFVICGLCLFAFLVFDLSFGSTLVSQSQGPIFESLFLWKYLALTLGSLVILGAYMYKKTLSDWPVKAYMICALSNIWVFTLYLVFGELWTYLDSIIVPGSAVFFHFEYLLFAAAIIATFFYAYIFQRIKLLSGPGVRVLSIVFYIIGVVMLIGLNASETPVDTLYLRPWAAATGGAVAEATAGMSAAGEAVAGATAGMSAGATAAGIAVLAALACVSVIAVRDLMRTIVAGRRVSIEWYPLAISGYSIVIVTQILIAQFGLSFSSVVISILYVLTALAWIFFGFSQRYSYIRRFGLGLAIFSVVKLVLVDLSRLTEGYRIISYFVLGGVLIAISFVYQYFSKRLELKDGDEWEG